MERVSLVVVGAGWHGISMARVYHEVHPERNIRVFDTASSVGGVWAKERLYPGLKTNNVVGTYELSDFEMVPAKYGLEARQHIPGAVVHQYFVDAAEYFDITRFLRFDTKVESATLKGDGTWLVSCSQLSDGTLSSTFDIIAEKLVIATGLTSEPYIPKFKGCFKGLIVHSKQLKDQAAELASKQTVVVIGSNKSAWDVCYSVARRGGKAHMIIRPSGGGPGYVWPKRLGRWNTSVAPMSSTRFFTLFDPWPWNENGVLGTLRQFFHKWAVGRWITTQFWTYLGTLLHRDVAFSNSENTSKLAPWYSVYWMGNSLSIHNYESSWYELARNGNIDVHIADVDSLSDDSIHLSDHSTITADALVCCTGWRAEPPIRFFPDDVLENLGIPGSKTTPQKLYTQARENVLLERPFLKIEPVRSSTFPLDPVDKAAKGGQKQPYSLYRYVVPSHPDYVRSKNLAFMGMHLSVHAVVVAQAQALWITAFFEDRITHLSSPNLKQEDIEYQTALHTEYQRIRRPRAAGGHGAGFPDLVFDSIPYVDSLFGDLGLQTRRKEGIWAEWFSPYRLKDYKGFVQEWKSVCKV